MIDYKEDTDAAGDAIAITGGLGYLLPEIRPGKKWVEHNLPSVCSVLKNKIIKNSGYL